jgi:hypothetical protein
MSDKKETNTTKDPKEMGQFMDDLNKKLYDKFDNSKVKSKLNKKKKKSDIPGYTYWFKK